MPLVKNQEIRLYIDSLTSEGSGVGRYEGMAVFVSGAAAGDTVLAHIIKVKKTYAIGKAIEILTPSADRIAPECPIFPSCGGCAFQHLHYPAELAHKLARVTSAFSRLAHLEVTPEEILCGEKERYRNKAEYPVRFDGALKIGFYAPHSHRVIDCADCLLQPSVFAEIIKSFRAFIIKNNISVYSEETGKGLLRHIYIRRAEVTGEIMTCAVINGFSLPNADALTAALADIPGMTSIVLSSNTENTNVILGKKTEILWGSAYITDVLCGLKIRISPLSFYQVNHNMAEKLYRKAAEFAALSGKETVLDLYCGAGTIGLSMAGHAKKIIGVEIIPEAIRDAKHNAAENGIANAEFFCGDASEAAQMLRSNGITPDVVILDPPRKGCAAELLETVVSMQPQKIVYVSCDPSTLARDCAVLAERGYSVRRAAAADLFPRTVHVECVVLMSRLKA